MQAAEGIGDEPAPAPCEAFSEIPLADCRPTNKNGVKVFSYSIRVSGLVETEQLEEAQKLVEKMQDRIDDRVNFVIRSADQKFLNEPGLETIKRQLKSEMDKLVGRDDLIVEILVPELLQTG